METKAKSKTKVFKSRSEIYYNMKNNKQNVLNSFENTLNSSVRTRVSVQVHTEKLHRFKVRKFPKNSLKFSHKF